MAKNLKHSIHRLHIFSVVNILIEEIVKDLLGGKEIKVPNFGTLKLNALKPKKIVGVNSGKITFAKRTKALRFRLSKKLYKTLFKGQKCEEK